jgi:hypothetical protein
MNSTSEYITEWLKTFSACSVAQAFLVFGLGLFPYAASNIAYMLYIPFLMTCVYMVIKIKFLEFKKIYYQYKLQRKSDIL